MNNNYYYLSVFLWTFVFAGLFNNGNSRPTTSANQHKMTHKILIISRCHLIILFEREIFMHSNSNNADDE